MANFRTITEHLNHEARDLEECHQNILKSIVSGIESIDAKLAISNRSVSFKKELKNATKTRELNWIKKSIFLERELSDVDAIYKIDSKMVCGGECGTQHFVNIVICLNNREILGTNFLKLEVAAAEQIRNNISFQITDKNVLGIFICLSESTLRNGGWDASYANGTEYSWAFKNAYKSSIRSNLVIIDSHFA